MYMHNAVSVQNLIFLHGIMYAICSKQSVHIIHYLQCKGNTFAHIFQIIMQNINNHSSGITHKKTMKILQNLFFSSYLYKPK